MSGLQLVFGWQDSQTEGIVPIVRVGSLNPRAVRRTPGAASRTSDVRGDNVRFVCEPRNSTGQCFEVQFESPHEEPLDLHPDTAVPTKAMTPSNTTNRTSQVRMVMTVTPGHRPASVPQTVAVSEESLRIATSRSLVNPNLCGPEVPATSSGSAPETNEAGAYAPASSDRIPIRDQWWNRWCRRCPWP